MAGGDAGSDERTRTLPRLFGVQYECPTDNAGWIFPSSGIGQDVGGDEDQLEVGGQEVRRRPNMGNCFHATIGELAALA